MKLLELMSKRVSYRKEFTDKNISIEELNYIVKAGFLAPSGCNMQTPRFIAVKDIEKVKEIANIYNHNWAKTSKACIVVITKPIAKNGKVSRYLEDFGAAAQNILLAITELGYATTWIQGQIEGEMASKIGEVLEVPEDYTVIGYFPIGEPKEEVSPPEKMSFEERCFLDSYGNKF